MPVVRFDVTERKPVAGGQAFGAAGAYQEVSGVAHLTADPKHPANRNVVDLELAPIGADGLVHYDADLVLTMPVTPVANGRLLVDVPNRGRPLASRLNSAQGYPAESANDTGNGFLLRQGFTMARVGWQYDAPDEPGRVRLRGPVAQRDGVPVTGPMLCQFQLPAATASVALSDRDHRAYPVADPADATALLTVRDHTADIPRPIDRKFWRFAQVVDGREQASPTHITLDGGFAPGLVYELTYTATEASIVGLGLLALRDLASWLRFDGGPGNPCAGSLAYAIGFGESQTGRMLRELAYSGLNEDEAGRQVYDGLFITVPGARRGEFNMRFGQPSKTLCDGLGAVYPFHDLGMMDPVTLRHDGLLARPRASGHTPKIMTVNTATEYWGGDRGSGGQASLLHTDPAGQRDVDPPATSRVYLLAGGQHVPLSWPVGDVDHLAVKCAQPVGSLDHRPLQRALLVALDQWVGQALEPPATGCPA